MVREAQRRLEGPGEMSWNKAQVSWDGVTWDQLGEVQVANVQVQVANTKEINSMATRPEGVPADATAIPPGQTFGPGIGVQRNTIISITAVNMKMNSQAFSVWANGMKYWAENAQQYKALGMKIPPPPAEPDMVETKVVYADANGTVVPPPEGADGNHWAWVWGE